jgi:hypothetical protein
MHGIPDRQVPLPDSLLNFQYMYNSTGSKVRRKVSSVCFCCAACSIMPLQWLRLSMTHMVYTRLTCCAVAAMRCCAAMKCRVTTSAHVPAVAKHQYCYRAHIHTAVMVLCSTAKSHTGVATLFCCCAVAC